MVLECPCACCGFYTGGESQYGCHNICKICGWQDDHVQLANPACRGGANGDSFTQVQNRFLDSESSRQSVIDGVQRDKQWRPLRPSEVTTAENELIQKPWMNKGIDVYNQSYWIVNRVPRDVRAEIFVIPTDQGGRSSPIFTGYRPQFYYSENDWVVSIICETLDGVGPGSEGEIDIGFMSPKDHVGKVVSGLDFELREGTRTIAKGKVVNLIDLSFSASLSVFKS